jgi:plasmid replication initiation protein
MKLITKDLEIARLVTMSNALIRAGHGLTLAEKRIVMIAISRLDSTKPLIDGVIIQTKITAIEYAKEFHVSLDTAYNQLNTASENLHDRKIVFYDPSYRRSKKKIDTTRTEMSWVGQVDYDPGTGFVVLHWWPNLMKHLMGLKKQFTSYKLQQASALRSVSSWRLLELLTRFKDNGWAQYDIDDFSIAMDATEKQKNDFAAIRRKIIEPAINELTRDGWDITWIQIKTGRKVKAIRFDFKRTAAITGNLAE